MTRLSTGIAASLVVCLTALTGLADTAAAAEQQTSLVTYEANQLPSDSSPSFQTMDGVAGVRGVSNGFLTMSVTQPVGSINNVRYDPLSDSDTAAFDFRVKIDASQPGEAGTISGAVVQVRWGGHSGALVLFVAPTGVIVNKGGINAPEFIAPIDTTSFHTYSLRKFGDSNMMLLVDGQSAFDKPLSQFDTFGAVSGWQSFSNNPSSTTTWDYFRYAIGPDAVTAVAQVPEPSMAYTMILGLMAVSLLRARKPTLFRVA